MKAKYSGPYKDAGNEDLSCLTAALQMLISIPKVMRMFLHRHYRTGNPAAITEISDEISRYIYSQQSANRVQDVQDVQDLLFILRVYSADAAMSSAHLPSLEIIFFRVLHDGTRITKED